MKQTHKIGVTKRSTFGFATLTTFIVDIFLVALIIWKINTFTNSNYETPNKCKKNKQFFFKLYENWKNHRTFEISICVRFQLHNA